MTTGKTLGQIGEDAYQRWLDTGAIGQSIDAIAAAVEAAVLQRAALTAAQPAAPELGFYEDVYEQCCEAIKPLVDAGRLPGSVVDSIGILVSAFNIAQPAPAAPYQVTDRDVKKALGIYYAITGLDEFSQGSLQDMRKVLESYEARKATA